MTTTQLSWSTEKRKVRDLVPAEYNPRQMNEKQAKELEKSLKKFGLVEIPAIDLDNTLLAGHMRMATMIQLGRGEEEIDVRVPNRKLTDAEAKEYNLRSNKNTGEWDMDKLFAMPEGLLEEVGWDRKTLDKLMGKIEERESINFDAKHEIIIEAKDESEQREIFDNLTAEGYVCRILTL